MASDKDYETVRALVHAAVQEVSADVVSEALHGKKKKPARSGGGKPHKPVKIGPPELAQAPPPDDGKFSLEVRTSSGDPAFRVRIHPDADVRVLLEEVGRRAFGSTLDAVDLKARVQSLRLSAFRETPREVGPARVPSVRQRETPTWGRNSAPRGDESRRLDSRETPVRRVVVVLEPGRRIGYYRLRRQEGGAGYVTMLIRGSGYTFSNSSQSTSRAAAACAAKGAAASGSGGGGGGGGGGGSGSRSSRDPEQARLSATRQRWQAAHTGEPAPPHRPAPMWLQPAGWGGSGRLEPSADEGEAAAAAATVSALEREAVALERARQRHVAFGRTWGGHASPVRGGSRVVSEDAEAPYHSGVATAAAGSATRPLDRREAYGLAQGEEQRPSSGAATGGHRRRPQSASQRRPASAGAAGAAGAAGGRTGARATRPRVSNVASGAPRHLREGVGDLGGGHAKAGVANQAGGADAGQQRRERQHAEHEEKGEEEAEWLKDYDDDAQPRRAPLGRGGGRATRSAGRQVWALQDELRASHHERNEARQRSARLQAQAVRSAQELQLALGRSLNLNGSGGSASVASRYVETLRAARALPPTDARIAERTALGMQAQAMAAADARAIEAAVVRRAARALPAPPAHRSHRNAARTTAVGRGGGGGAASTPHAEGPRAAAEAAAKQHAERLLLQAANASAPHPPTMSAHMQWLVRLASMPLDAPPPPPPADAPDADAVGSGGGLFPHYPPPPLPSERFRERLGGEAVWGNAERNAELRQVLTNALGEDIERALVTEIKAQQRQRQQQHELFA